METVTGRIAVWLTCFLHAPGDHLSGDVFIIGSFFFFLFAFHTDRLMIKNWQNTPISFSHCLIASFTLFSAWKLFFPIFRHCYSCKKIIFWGLFQNRFCVFHHNTSFQSNQDVRSVFAESLSKRHGSATKTKKRCEFQSACGSTMPSELSSASLKTWLKAGACILIETGLLFLTPGHDCSEIFKQNFKQSSMLCCFWWFQKSVACLK